MAEVSWLYIIVVFVMTIDLELLCYSVCFCGILDQGFCRYGVGIFPVPAGAPLSSHVDCDRITPPIGGVTRNTLPLRNERWCRPDSDVDDRSADRSFATWENAGSRVPNRPNQPEGLLG